MFANVVGNRVGQDEGRVFVFINNGKGVVSDLHEISKVWLIIYTIYTIAIRYIRRGLLRLLSTYLYRTGKKSCPADPERFKNISTFLRTQSPRNMRMRNFFLIQHVSGRQPLYIEFEFFKTTYICVTFLFFFFSSHSTLIPR